MLRFGGDGAMCRWLTPTRIEIVKKKKKSEIVFLFGVIIFFCACGGGGVCAGHIYSWKSPWTRTETPLYCRSHWLHRWMHRCLKLRFRMISWLKIWRTMLPSLQMARFMLRCRRFPTCLLLNFQCPHRVKKKRFFSSHFFFLKLRFFFKACF